MSFKEKSAWIMSVALVVSGILYFMLVVVMSTETQMAPPLLPIMFIYTLILIVMAIVGHIIIAIMSPKDANQKTDERERAIITKAAYWSGHVLGAGVLCSLLLYMFSYNGSFLFYAVFASLMISQIMEYLIQIYFFRRGMG